MKRIFIIFVMLVAIGSAYESKAQSKKFRDAYKYILDCSAYNREHIEVSHFTGEMLQMMVKDDSNAPMKLKNRINSIYQIKIADAGEFTREFDNLIRLLRSVVNEGKYDPCGTFTSNGVKYEIYRTAVGDLNEYLIFITKGKQFLACDIYGIISYKEVLSMISPSLPQKNDLQIDTLNTN